MLATLLPVDKIIGKIYPLFAIALLFMAVGILAYGPEGIHRILRQATGGTSEREHTLSDFLWNYDSPGPSHNQLQDSQCHP